MIPFHTNDSHKKTSYIIIIMRINIFVVINQINKHKLKIYNHCKYTKIVIKSFLLLKYKKIFGFGKYKHDKSIIRQAETNSTN